MNIKGLAGFTSFINKNNLSGIHPEVSNLCRCVDEYKRLCNCDTVDIKNKKMNQCTSFYMNFMRRVGDYKHLFFSKTADSSISFYNDSNQRLATISR